MSTAIDRKELDQVRRAITELLETGQSYSIVGGHSVTNPRLSELQAREQQLRIRILRAQGYAGRIG